MKSYTKTYLKNRPLFFAAIRGKEASLFVSERPFNKPILDFGCGDGFFAKVVFNGPRKIEVGVDVDKQKLKEARREEVYKEILHYTGNKLPFSDNQFSTVVSNCVLEHIDDLEGNLSEIYRILKPKGKFICTVMTDKWEEYLFGKIFFGSLYASWMRRKQIHKQLLSKKQWDLKFKNAGFKIEKTIGYLDKRATRWTDLLHYVSLPSLFSYKLFGKWVLFPWQYDLVPVDKMFNKLVNKKVSVGKSAALFYELRKEK